MSVPTNFSDEITANRPPLYAPLKTNRAEGRVRTCNFRLTLAGQAAGARFAVAKLPKGARIVSGEIIASATLAGTAQMAVGLAGADNNGNIDDALASGPGYKPDGTAVTVGTPVADSDTCLKAAAVLSTTQVPFAITQALGYLYETAKEVYVTLVTSVGTVATEVVTGSIRYTVD